jgi:hypothetical protein
MQTRFDTEARIAVTQAADIARELGHREVGPGHLLAGLLANPRGTAYAALHDHGLELEPTRALVATHHVDPEAESDHDHDSGEQSADSAGYDEDREALKAIGIDLDRVRDAVRANLGDDLAERWADRPRRERGRSRRRHHHHGQGRGRRGPRSRRDGLRFSRELRALLRDARRSVLRAQLDAADGGDRDAVRRVPGLTGARLLVALTRSDDPAVQAVLAVADSLDGLRAQAEQVVGRQVH